MGAVAEVIGAEGGGAQAVGDALFHGPEDCLVEEVRFLHIHEGIGIGAGLRASCGAPEEGDHLGTHAILSRSEGGGGGAIGDSLLHGPQHRVIVEGAIRDIGEGISQRISQAVFLKAAVVALSRLQAGVQVGGRDGQEPVSEGMGRQFRMGIGEAVTAGGAGMGGKVGAVTMDS